MNKFRAVTIVLLLTSGCYASVDIRFDEGLYDAGTDPDAGRDARSDGADLDAAPDMACTPMFVSRPVDILFVVDNSPSMVEEESGLASKLPDFIHALATGDRDGDGTPDFTPVADLHAGVIDVSMGVGGIPNVPTCTTNPDFGDDGVLLDVPRVGGVECAPMYTPRFLSYVAGGNVTQFSADLACLAPTGTDGCGFEQQLDAMLKAVEPHNGPTMFYAGTHGHGDDPATNGGFLRKGSLLVIIMITDEDDCSTHITDIWSPGSTVHTGDLNLRCIDYFDELYPITRFVDGLRSLENDVLFLAITGVPDDLAPAGSTSIDYDRLFADPRMKNTTTTMGTVTTLNPACSSTGSSVAAPAIRIASLARALGTQGFVQSICTADYGPAFGALVGLIADHNVSMTCSPLTP